jgi:putative oligomerization/nucleic acid binding protein
LAELRSNGVLTDAEFQELKARLLRTNRTAARLTRSALEEKLAKLRSQHKTGQISDGEYERAAKLARLEDENERGEITDADYERAVTAIQRAHD